MQIGKAPVRDATGRMLSQGSVDGFWILLVFGLLFFNPLSVGSVGSKINLSLYDVLLPLIFFFELVRGRIWWPGRKIVRSVTVDTVPPRRAPYNAKSA